MAFLLSRNADYRTAAMTHKIHIIGGGLAGSEAAWQLAEAGVKVRLSRDARLAAR